MMKYSVIFLATQGASAFASGLTSASISPLDNRFLSGRALISSKISRRDLEPNGVLVARSLDDGLSAVTLQRRGGGGGGAGGKSSGKNKNKKSRGKGGSGAASGSGSESGSGRAKSGSPTGLSPPASQPKEAQNPTGRPPRPASSSSLSSLPNRYGERAMSRLSLSDMASSSRTLSDFNKFDRHDKLERWEQTLQPLASSPPQSPKSPKSPKSHPINSLTAEFPGASNAGQSPRTPTRGGSSDSLYGRKMGSSGGTKRLLMTSPRGSLGSPSTSAIESPMTRDSNFGSTNSFGSMTSPSSAVSPKGPSPATIGGKPLQEASPLSNSRSNSPVSSPSRSRDTARGGADDPQSPRSPKSPTSSNSGDSQAISRRPRSRAGSPSSPTSSRDPIDGQRGVGLSDVYELQRLQQLQRQPKPKPPKTYLDFVAHNHDVLSDLRDMVPTRTPAPQHLIDSAETARDKARLERATERVSYKVAKHAFNNKPASDQATVNAIRTHEAAARAAVHFTLKSVRAKQTAAPELAGTQRHELAEKYVKSAAREFQRAGAMQAHHQSWTRQVELAKAMELGPPRKAGARAKWDMERNRDRLAVPRLRSEYEQASRDATNIRQEVGSNESSSEDEERPVEKGFDPKSSPNAGGRQ